MVLRKFYRWVVCAIAVFGPLALPAQGQYSGRTPSAGRLARPLPNRATRPFLGGGAAFLPGGTLVAPYAGVQLPGFEFSSFPAAATWLPGTMQLPGLPPNPASSALLGYPLLSEAAAASLGLGMEPAVGFDSQFQPGDMSLTPVAPRPLPNPNYQMGELPRRANLPVLAEEPLNTARWNQLADWLSLPSAAVFYDYSVRGEDVYTTANQRAATAREFSQRAMEIAGSLAASDSAATDEWLTLEPLQVNDLTRQEPLADLKLSLSKSGAVRGSYLARTGQTSLSVRGTVDKEYQRLACWLGDQKELVFETGLQNLTQAAAPALIHDVTAGTSVVFWIARSPAIPAPPPQPPSPQATGKQ